jgi:hypothetical protein
MLTTSPRIRSRAGHYGPHISTPRHSPSASEGRSACSVMFVRQSSSPVLPTHGSRISATHNYERDVKRAQLRRREETRPVIPGTRRPVRRRDAAPLTILGWDESRNHLTRRRSVREAEDCAASTPRRSAHCAQCVSRSPVETTRARPCQEGEPSPLAARSGVHSPRHHPHRPRRESPASQNLARVSPPIPRTRRLGLQAPRHRLVNKQPTLAGLGLISLIYPAAEADEQHPGQIPMCC